MTIAQFLLLPFSCLYGVLAQLRIILFRGGHLPRVRPKSPSIGIGNLRAGGTGKTPFADYLLKCFSDLPTVYIARGYKRKSKGLVTGWDARHWQDLGDEPWLISKKHPKTLVLLCNKRVRALRHFEQHFPGKALLIFDDVFQHRYIQPGLNILLTEFHKPFFADYPLPAGRLREFRKNARECDLLLVTKSPAILSPIERRHFIAKTKKYGVRAIIFSYLVYPGLIPLDEYLKNPGSIANLRALPKKDRDYVIGFCGIGNPEPFQDFLRENSEKQAFFSFADHHDYTAADLMPVYDRCKNAAKAEPIIITTEKDALKLGFVMEHPQLKNLPMFVLPVEFRLHDEDASTFQEIVNHYVRSNSINSSAPA